MQAARQLPLPFGHSPAFHALDFMPDDSNAEALAWLERTADWPDRRLALWGPAGCGKTHLLHVWSERTGALLLHGPALRDLPVLAGAAGIVVDDADSAAREETLLHVLNAARDAALPVLLSGRTPPARWPVSLPDLRSRLRAVTAIQIGPPGDDLLARLLAHLLADRQLAVPVSLQAWLLRRLPRSAAAQREAVARLDHAALSLGRAITRGLAVAVLADLLRTETDESFVADTPPSSNGAALL